MNISKQDANNSFTQMSQLLNQMNTQLNNQNAFLNIKPQENQLKYIPNLTLEKAPNILTNQQIMTYNPFALGLNFNFNLGSLWYGTPIQGNILSLENNKNNFQSFPFFPPQFFNKHSSNKNLNQDNNSESTNSNSDDTDKKDNKKIDKKIIKTDGKKIIIDKRPKKYFKCLTIKNIENGKIRKVRRRHRKNMEQIKLLDNFYKEKKNNWTKEQIRNIANVTGLKESKVYKWLWDKRNKDYRFPKFVVNKEN